MQSAEFVILKAAWAFNGVASAEIVAETLCFTAQVRGKQPSQLKLKKYLDLDLQQEIGALVQYGSSKAKIPLTYIGGDSSDPTSDYELHWIEIVIIR